jgi:uncharacterized membrane protein
VTTSKPSTLKKIGDALNTGDDKGVMIAVAVSLIIIIGVVAGYYVYHVIYEKPEGYSEIYVLDAQGKALNYVFNFTVNQDATFNVYVVNHLGNTHSVQVQEKITNQPTPVLPVNGSPVQTFTKTIADGETWAIQAPVAVGTPGSYNVFFELWLDNSGTPQFTTNAAKLSVDAVNQP